MPDITTVEQLDQAAAKLVVPAAELSRNGLPSRVQWVGEDPVRARAAWIAVSNAKPSRDWRADQAAREECHLFAKVIFRNTNLPETEVPNVYNGPDGRRLWLDRVVLP